MGQILNWAVTYIRGIHDRNNTISQTQTACTFFKLRIGPQSIVQKAKPVLQGTLPTHSQKPNIW